MIYLVAAAYVSLQGYAAYLLLITVITQLELARGVDLMPNAQRSHACASANNNNLHDPPPQFHRS